MKKTTIFLISTLCALSILFSSCLGDTKSSMSPDKSLSYIISKDGQQYALTAEQIYITSSFVQKLDAQKFYNLKYSWSTDDTQSSGIYQLNNITYSTGETYPIQENSTFDIKNETDYETLGKNDLLGLTSFVPYYFSATNLMNDKWVFQCTVSAYKEDLEILNGTNGANNIRLNIVVQPNNQTSLGNNQAVLDVYLERINDLAIDTSKQKVTDSFLVVVNLSRLRTYLDNRLYQESTGDKYTLAYNQFRYYKYVTVNSGSNYFEDKQTSVGALTGDNNIYPLQIGGKQPN